MTSDEGAAARGCRLTIFFQVHVTALLEQKVPA